MIIAMVPMRSGSKSIPDKNVKRFLCKPLFMWNLEVLYKCVDEGIIDQLFINTNSKEYGLLVGEHLKDFYRPEIFYRDERTARDGAVNIDVAQEFIEKMDMENEDILLYVQVTSPYLKVEDVKACIYSFDHIYTGNVSYLDENIYYPKYNSAMTIAFDTQGFIIRDGRPELGARDTPRQKLFRTRTNGCIYSCTTAGAIRETASLWKEPIYYHPQDYGFELDEPADWVYGEEVMKCE